jgi:hypothetical protein
MPGICVAFVASAAACPLKALLAKGKFRPGRPAALL